MGSTVVKSCEFIQQVKPGRVVFAVSHFYASDEGREKMHNPAIDEILTLNTLPTVLNRDVQGRLRKKLPQRPRPMNRPNQRKRGGGLSVVHKPLKVKNGAAPSGAAFLYPEQAASSAAQNMSAIAFLTTGRCFIFLCPFVVAEYRCCISLL